MATPSSDLIPITHFVRRLHEAKSRVQALNADIAANKDRGPMQMVLLDLKREAEMDVQMLTIAAKAFGYDLAPRTVPAAPIPAPVPVPVPAVDDTLDSLPPLDTHSPTPLAKSVVWPKVSSLTVSFKAGLGRGVSYNKETVSPGHPLYFGRKKQLQNMEQEIQDAGGTTYSPTIPSISALMPSKGYYAKIEYLMDPKPGYYIVVKEKEPGKGPTNPLWKIVGADWKHQKFSPDPIPVKNGDQFSVGTHFKFHIGSRRAAKEMLPAEPLNLEPASIVGDETSDSEAEEAKEEEVNLEWDSNEMSL